MSVQTSNIGPTARAGVLFECHSMKMRLGCVMQRNGVIKVRILVSIENQINHNLGAQACTHKLRSGVHVPLIVLLAWEAIPLIRPKEKEMQ